MVGVQPAHTSQAVLARLSHLAERACNMVINIEGGGRGGDQEIQGLDRGSQQVIIYSLEGGGRPARAQGLSLTINTGRTMGGLLPRMEHPGSHPTQSVTPHPRSGALSGCFYHISSLPHPGSPPPSPRPR